MKPERQQRRVTVVIREHESGGIITDTERFSRPSAITRGAISALARSRMSSV